MFNFRECGYFYIIPIAWTRTPSIGFIPTFMMTPSGLQALLKIFLYVTRLNDGRLKLNLSDQLADEVIAEAVSHLCRKSAEHTITVQCEDLLLVRMDAQLIIQVLVNLIDNAIKYTPAGSEIRISAQKQGNYAMFNVSDNGNGIPDDVKPHIFEMFYTGKNKISDSRRSFWSRSYSL